MRPMMDSGMSGEQQVVNAFPSEGPSGNLQDDYFPRQQSSMRRLPMDQMSSMAQIYGDRAAMVEHMQAPYGNMASGKSEMYAGNFRDGQGGVGGGSDYGMPQMGGSEEYMGMASQMRRPRPPA
jgi:hypothetical protein